MDLVCCTLAILGVVISLILVAVKLYVKLTTGWCTSQKSLVGKTVIVTGANSGLGYEAAVDFAKRGARVILACRNRSKADEAQRNIVEETENPNVIVKLVDMESFESVRKFARDINETEERLDILVNNAGLGGLGNAMTKDGLLTVMQVNYFSPFLLTILLLDIMKRTSGLRRIVNVASIAGKFAITFNPKQLNVYPEKLPLPDFVLYNRSKLCNILFTMALAKKLEGTGITTYSAHPGLVITDFFRNMNVIKRFFTRLGVSLFFKSSLEGVQSIIYVAVQKGIEYQSGGHFADCKLQKRYKTASHPGLPEKTWEITEDFVKFLPEERKLFP